MYFKTSAVQTALLKNYCYVKKQGMVCAPSLFLNVIIVISAKGFFHLKKLLIYQGQIGRGYSAAYKLCATLNFPQMSKRTYTSHEEKLLKAVSEVAECSMRNAADDIVKQQKCRG